MIPILYCAKETDFTHGGIGHLADALTCTVTECRNGSYELEMKYPVSGLLYSQIDTDCIIKAKPNDTGNLQLFRIYKHSKPINGIVTYNAEHISYELSGIPVESVSVKTATCAAALNAALSAAVTEHNYSAWSDIDTLNSISQSLVSVRAAIGGVKGSILDVYGGELEFDNFKVKLHKSRGTDNGVRISYGKNLTNVKQEKNISEVYTAVYPYAKYTPENGEETTITLPEKLLYSPYAANYGSTRICFKDFSNNFADEAKPTVQQLRKLAEAWIKTSGFDKPSISITVSFKHLWKSPEYKQYALLERVNLCDTVTVYYERLGISAKAKVIKTVYNVLTEDYNTIELGDAKANFADTFNSSSSAIEGVKTEIKKQFVAADVKLTQAIAEATAAITGQNGGYVVLNPPKNPHEILIMDSPDIETATNIWRWNSAGLGHSANGYNGPYSLAMTADGSIVADFITAGTLNGALLSAGSVTANALSAAYKKEVKDEISGVETSVSQSFKAADEELSSTITAKFADYSTTAQMNSAILQKANEISLSVSETLTGYPTKAQVSSEISQLADKISLVVTSSESGASAVNSASIIAAINDDGGLVKIDAGKIDLTAYALADDVSGIASEAAQAEIGAITLTATNGETSSTIKIKHNGTTVDSATITFTGTVTFSDLETEGNTVINGANITTGIISADYIDTNSLACTKLYAKGNADGYSVRLNGNAGDFGVFSPSASDNDISTSQTCLFGIRNVLPNVNFYVQGHNYMGVDFTKTEKRTYPKGVWDFSSCDVLGLGVVPAFG